MYVVRRRVKTKKLRNVFIGRNKHLRPHQKRSLLLPTKPQPEKKRKKVEDAIVTSEFWRRLGYSEHRIESVLSLKVDIKQI